MIRQCAWCLKMMGEVAPLQDKRITHGMCEECNVQVLKKMAEKVKKAS